MAYAYTMGVTSLRIEASTVCQLRCPSCPTTHGTVKEKLGAGFLDLDKFRRLLDENGAVRTVELSNWGEAFLHPQFVKLLEISAERKVAVTLSNGVNFNHVTESTIEALVKYQVQRISFSIDGASQETYEKYRVRGDFDRVIGNLRLLVETKKRYESTLPELTWQFVAFGHNQHEVQKAREMAQSLGMHFFLKLNFDTTFSPLSSPKEFARENGLVAGSRWEYENKSGEAYLPKICQQLWDSPQVNWDGRVLGCCVNTWGDFGNAFTQGLSTVLSGEKLSYAKKMLLGSVPARADIPCTTCARYRPYQPTTKGPTDIRVRLAERWRAFGNTLRRGLRILSPRG